MIGQGRALDASSERYPYITSGDIASATLPTDGDCIDYCLQNSHPDLVGVEVYRNSGDVNCRCLFSGTVPGSIDLTTYDPDAASSSSVETGTGVIQSILPTADVTCYRNEVRHDVMLIDCCVSTFDP